MLISSIGSITGYPSSTGSGKIGTGGKSGAGLTLTLPDKTTSSGGAAFSIKGFTISTAEMVGCL